MTILTNAKITSDRNMEIVALYDAGWNIFKLGDRFNLAPATVRSIITKARGSCRAEGIK